MTPVMMMPMTIIHGVVLAVWLGITGESGTMGVACVIPQTAKDIEPETKIEQEIRLIAVLPGRGPARNQPTTHECYSSATRMGFL